MSSTSQHLLLSPAELAYLHGSLSLITPGPIRPDGRSPTQFRPLTAETGILPGTNGSARICFADGTEAVVGVKAEVEKTPVSPYEFVASTEGRKDHTVTSTPQKKIRKSKKAPAATEGGEDEIAMEVDEDEEAAAAAALDKVRGSPDWVELSVEIPGLRDDDSGTIFLTSMLTEALLADGEFVKKLWINRRFHWKIYLDIILISPPLSYPLPLLSLTTHLALLATRLPRLKSEADEDPMFDDDWAAATFLYPRQDTSSGKAASSKSSKQTSTAAAAPPASRPPITLLVMAVGDNIIFDPSKEELAVADSAVAVSVAEGPSSESEPESESISATTTKRNLHLLSVRTIDPPSRLTPPGVPNSVNASAWGTMTAATAASAAAPASASASEAAAKHPDARVTETEDVVGVWKAPRGGAKFAMLGAMVAKVLERGGVAEEVLDGLEGVDLG
ncbi:hypothetical protein PG996_004334 [Apiospora saccharicola]|uniref:Ribosomal RNA-processing protein 42 n=1 Tax=Apiospora saccharicola TaxID=335842 RepID=A0ABR1W3V0_9PEZI